MPPRRFSPLRPRPLAQENPAHQSGGAEQCADAGAGRDRAATRQIVVTARRRDELLLNVPIAVTAYSGEQLDRQGALDITDVAKTTPERDAQGLARHQLAR